MLHTIVPVACNKVVIRYLELGLGKRPDAPIDFQLIKLAVFINSNNNKQLLYIYSSFQKNDSSNQSSRCEVHIITISVLGV